MARTMCSRWAALAALLASAAAGANVELRQANFNSGTYIIDTPGTYVLVEDVVFRPDGVIAMDSPETWMFPDTSKAPYNASPFRLGFFAAIVIAADDVTLDLQGHTLSQSRDHSKIQRFFSLIELSNSPFPPGAGPAAFVEKPGFKASTNVVIKNGVIGLSAHHGIHGNNNRNIRLENLEFVKFEVAAIALNQVDDLVIRNVHVHSARSDVPVDGRLSNAIFLLQAVKKYISVDTNFDGGVTGYELQRKIAALRTKVAYFFSNSLDPGNLFTSVTDGLPDGSMLAGIMIHSNFNVGNFLGAQPIDFSSNIELENVTISDLVASPGEYGTLVSTLSGASEVQDSYNSDKHAHDAIGAVLDMDKCTESFNGTIVYKPNVLADAQLAFARYAHACLAENSGCTSASNPGQAALLRRNTITPIVAKWAAGLISWEEMMKTYVISTNHDIMFHHVKGVIGLKLDGVAKVSAKDVFVYNLKNDADRTRRSTLAMETNKEYAYAGYSVRAVSVAASVNVDLSAVGASDLSSAAVEPICVDAMNGFSQVSFKNIGVQKSLAEMPTESPVSSPKTFSAGAVAGATVGGLLGGVLLSAGLFFAKSRYDSRRPPSSTVNSLGKCASA